MEQPASVRVDSWTWAVRAAKTRSAAAAACRAGHVRVNGERAKPSTPVRVGDEVRVRGAERDRVLVALALIVKRVSAEEAARCVDDRTPPPPPREAKAAPVAVRDRGAGRPTKRDRREIDRWRTR